MTDIEPLSPIEAIWHQAEKEIAEGKSVAAVAPLLGLLPPAFKKAVRCRASRGLWSTPIHFPLRPANTRTDNYTTRKHLIPEIIALFALSSMTAPQIAARLNVPVGYIYKIAKNKNHSFLARPRLGDRIDWTELEQRFAEGTPIYHLAQELMTSHAGLAQMIRNRANRGLWTTPLKRPKGALPQPLKPKTNTALPPVPDDPTWDQIKAQLSTLGHGWITALAAHLNISSSGASYLLRRKNTPQPDRVRECHKFLMQHHNPKTPPPNAT
jgi:hypothetical protein